MKRLRLLLIIFIVSITLVLTGCDNNYKIIFDANLGIDYATNDSFDDFDEWETVTDTPDIFPESFEWNDQNKYKLKQKNMNTKLISWIKEYVNTILGGLDNLYYHHYEHTLEVLERNSKTFLSSPKEILWLMLFKHFW